MTRLSISKAIDQYLVSIENGRCSPATLAWYAKRLRPLRSIHKSIERVTLDDLQRAYNQLASRKEQYKDHPSRKTIKQPLSPSTLRGYVRAWRAFGNWLVEVNLVS